MRDESLIKVIESIPQQTQRQYGTDEQLRYLRMVANKLGLYDAADRLANDEFDQLATRLKQNERSPFMRRVDLIMSRRHSL